MASNQLTDTERSELDNAVENLVGRGVPFMPFPITNRGALHDFWLSMFPKEIEDAYRVFRQQYDYLLASDASGTQDMLWGNYRIRVNWRAAEEPGPYNGLAYRARARGHKLPTWGQERSSAFFPHQGIQLEAMEKWVSEVGQFHYDATDTLKTFRDIMGMANTPGQIYRMVPELAMYFKQGTKQKLSDSGRASPLPKVLLDPNKPAGPDNPLIHKWDLYDKDRVTLMCNTLAKCWLLPPLPNKSARYSDLIDQATWVRWTKDE